MESIRQIVFSSLSTLLIVGVLYTFTLFVYKNFIMNRLPKQPNRELMANRKAWWFPVLGNLLYVMKHTKIADLEVLAKELNDLEEKSKTGF